MKKFKKILLYSFWCLLIIGLMLSLGFVNKEQDSLLCRKLDIRVNQDNDLYFVDKIDIANILKDRGDSIIGQPKATVNITDIEKTLNSHAAISKAEVSLSIDGTVKVDVLQRNPILRVINSGGDSYYLDDEGKLMPLSDKYTMKVPIANGKLNEPYSKNYGRTVQQIGEDSALRATSKLDDLFAMAQYIHADDFWRSQIHQIYINDNDDMEIVPLAGDQKIIFGDTTAMDEKFKKLLTFYQQGLNTTGWWDKYSTINLKFRNQIVCTKKQLPIIKQQ
jgi:cell division protein FtsQ